MNPYEGLKQINHQESLDAPNVSDNMNPYEGLKHSTELGTAPRPDVSDNMNPYEGLKQDVRIFRKRNLSRFR